MLLMLRIAMVDVTPAVESVTRAAPSPTVMAVVSSATTMDSITTAGSLVCILELNDIHSSAVHVGCGICAFSVMLTLQCLLAEAPTTTTAFTVATTRCPKCTVANKSGQLSCCARGGAWFKKCGYPGDTNFEHTWFEGFGACKSKFCRVKCAFEN